MRGCNTGAGATCRSGIFSILASTHLLDMLMQSPMERDADQPARRDVLQLRALSARAGPGDAVQLLAEDRRCTARFRGCRFDPPDNYLRDNMIRTLDETDVEFEMRVQLQTDPFLMPIENNAVLWPERLSPRVPVATLRIPRQKFDDPGAVRLYAQSEIQPLALSAGPSAARQSEPRAQADVRRTGDRSGRK